MMKLQKYIVLLAFAGIGILLTIANANAIEKTKSFLWKVESNENSLYLLGSVHMANKTIYPLNKIIEESFNRASVLAVELNDKNVDSAKMQHLIVTQGMYNKNDSIKAHIPGDLYNLLEKFLVENKIPKNNYYSYKPGILSMVLSSVQAKNLGYSPAYGIDRYFLDKAEQQHKTIVELESMEEQLSLFLNMPEDVLMLRYTLDELSNMNTEFDEMLNYWRTGNHKKLNVLTIDQPLKNRPELKPIFEKLFFARNRRMTDNIISFLESGKLHFVVVGAGHLIGNLGILELLKKRHYSVKQL